MEKLADYRFQSIPTNRILSALDAGLLLRYILALVGDIRLRIKHRVFTSHALMFEYPSYLPMPSDEAFICHSCTPWRDSPGQSLPPFQMCGMRIIGTFTN